MVGKFRGWNTASKILCLSVRQRGGAIPERDSVCACVCLCLCVCTPVHACVHFYCVQIGCCIARVVLHMCVYVGGVCACACVGPRFHQICMDDCGHK